MKHALALALLAAPTFAFADCTSQSAFFSAALESRGYVIEAMNDVVERDGNCALEGIVFTEENLTVDIAEVSWRLEGLEALTSGAGVLTFDAVLTDLRLSPRTTDRWVSYMLAQQNRRNTIDATFNASWDFTAGTLEITSLDIDLPGDNRVTFTQSVSGATASLLTGNYTALEALSLDNMALTIENHGFADALILGPLVARLSDVPGSPETVMDGTKRDLRALVSNLPTDVFDADTKSALVQLINAGPVPWGELTIKTVANPTISIGPIFAAGIYNFTPESISALFQGGRIEVTFDEDTGDK